MGKHPVLELGEGSPNYMSPQVLFDFVDCPDPELIMFRVGMSTTVFRPEMLPRLGDRYAATQLPNKPRLDQGEFRHFTYAHKELERTTDQREPSGIIWLYFAPPFDPDAADTGRPFRAWSTTRPHRWPMVLRNLWFVDDPSMPLSALAPTASGSTGQAAVFAPRVYARWRRTPAALASCQVDVEQFVSSRPWAPQENPQPLEGDVSWDFLGSSGSMSCLHPEIRIPARGSDYRVVVDGTQGSAPAPLSQGRLFPATPFPDWDSFVLSDDVQFVDGLYVKEVMTIHPPPPPEDEVL